MDWKPIWRRRCNRFDCGKEIPAKAVRKGAHFCSAECRQQDRYDGRIDEKLKQGKKLSQNESARVQAVNEAESRASELINEGTGNEHLVLP